MSNVFTLDSLREEVEKEYAPVKVTVAKDQDVVLRNLLRVPKKAREELFGLLDEMENLTEGKDDEAEMSVDELEKTAGIATRMIELVADGPHKKKLIDALNDDMALTLKVFEAWMEASNPGEAPRSPA